MTNLSKDYNPPTASSHSPKGEWAPEIKRLKSLPGESIGAGFADDIRFILDEKGEEGLSKIETAMAELGCPKYREIKNFEWYPIGCYLISLLLAKELFGWDDEMIRKMGESGPKVSLISRMMAKYFVSVRRIFEEAANHWSMFYTAGELEPVEMREEEGYCLLFLRNFSGHQVFCRYLEGAISTIASFGIKNPECREIECCLKGEGKGHLFKVSWEK